jgi:hypothetical protein
MGKAIGAIFIMKGYKTMIGTFKRFFLILADIFNESVFSPSSRYTNRPFNNQNIFFIRIQYACLNFSDAITS